MPQKYPLFRVRTNSTLALKNIEEVFDSGYINEGVQVAQLENELKSFLGINNLTLVNSGTSALTIALRVAGVTADSEVISTSMTCIATNTPIVNLGAKIVWADIDKNTGMIDAKDVERKITNKTKAIMIVDWAGSTPNLTEFEELSKSTGIPIIQDAAHAFGAKYGKKSIAEFADFTCFSFQAIKHFTTGDGGALYCKNEKDLKLVRKLKWFGYNRDVVKDEKGEWRGQNWDADVLINEIGYKFNMNNYVAALGLANLNGLQDSLKSHQRNAETLHKILKNHPKIELLKKEPDCESVYWVYTIRLKASKEKRDYILQKLNEIGIAAGLVHLPNHEYSAFSEFATQLPETEAFSESQISLPCGWWLSEKDCIFIANKLMNLLDEN